VPPPPAAVLNYNDFRGTPELRAAVAGLLVRTCCRVRAPVLWLEGCVQCWGVQLGACLGELETAGGLLARTCCRVRGVEGWLGGEGRLESCAKNLLPCDSTWQLAGVRPGPCQIQRVDGGRQPYAKLWHLALQTLNPDP
jgi:hypothetical protein